MFLNKKIKKRRNRDFPAGTRCSNALNLCGINVAGYAGIQIRFIETSGTFAVFDFDQFFLFVKNESSYHYIFHFIAIAFVVFFN